MESLEAALKKKDFDNAISAINTLAADDLDVLCKTLLAFAATVREPKDAMPLIATHAACEISRTMGTDSALPMVQAVSYLFEKR